MAEHVMHLGYDNNDDGIWLWCTCLARGPFTEGRVVNLDREPTPHEVALAARVHEQQPQAHIQLVPTPPAEPPEDYIELREAPTPAEALDDALDVP